MSTLKEIQGRNIKSVSSDPSPIANGDIWYNSTSQTLKGVVQVGSWSSGGALNVARSSMTVGNIGTQTSALAVGGYVGPSRSNATEEYNGSSWTAQNVTPTTLSSRGVAGTQTAALAFGGNPDPSTVTTTTEYDGTNWGAGGALTNARGYGPVGAGTQTAGMAIGGYNPPVTFVTAVEFYNGSSWTTNPVAGPSLYGGAGSGTQAAAWVAGASAVSPAPVNQKTYEWDGSSWTAGGSYVMAAVANIFGGGPTTTAWVSGGDADPGLRSATNHYDGTSWSTAASMATARSNGGSSGSQTASLAMGGGTPPATTATEEYNLVATTKTFTTS